MVKRFPQIFRKRKADEELSSTKETKISFAIERDYL